MEFCIEPGQGMPCDRAALSAHLATMRPLFGSLRVLGEWTERADRKRFEAHTTHPTPRPTRRQLETVVDVVLGQRGVEEVISHPSEAPDVSRFVDLAGNAASLLGHDRAFLVDALTTTVPRARARGILPKLVEVQRREDRRRLAQRSDFTDEVHLAFGACADVLTVDGNVRHILSAIDGRPLPSPVGRDPRRGAIYMVEVRHLAHVAALVTGLGQEPPGNASHSGR